MFVTETKLLELRGDSAVVSLKDLFQIVELPSGTVVGELANGDEAAFERSEFWDVATSTSPYRVAVEYSLLSALRSRGLSVSDVAIAPTSGTTCRWCGSEIRRRTKNTCVFTCGTQGKRDQDRYHAKTKGFDVFWSRSGQASMCEQLQEARIKSMGPKSALLRSVLIDMGVESPDSEEWWIFDGRGDDDQFPGIAVGSVPVTPVLTSLGSPMAAAALLA